MHWRASHVSGGRQRQRQDIGEIVEPRLLVCSDRDDARTKRRENSAALMEFVKSFGDLLKPAVAHGHRGRRAYPGIPQGLAGRRLHDQVLEAALGKTIQPGGEGRVVDAVQQGSFPTNARPRRGMPSLGKGRTHDNDRRGGRGADGPKINASIASYAGPFGQEIAELVTAPYPAGHHLVPTVRRRASGGLYARRSHGGGVIPTPLPHDGGEA